MTTLLKRVRDSLEYRLEFWAQRHCKLREQQRLERSLGLRRGHGLSLDDLKLARILCKHRNCIKRLIDVGAHKGAFTHLADRVFDLETVICVEPDSSLHPELLDRVPSQATLIPQALSRVEGRATLYLHPDQSMNSLVQVGDEFDNLNPHYHRSKIRQTEIDTRPLDALLPLLGEGSSKDTLLKIDVQGHEMDVLLSGTNVLARCAVVVCEYTFWHGYQKSYDLADLATLLREQGLVARDLGNVGYRGESTSFADIVFSRH